MPKSKADHAPAPATRTVTVPGPEDLQHAGEDALLQLRIGRSAHLYAVVISAALALDGVLVLLLDPNLPGLPGAVVGLRALNDAAFLLVPVAAGVAIALIGLSAKWEAFQLWPWEPHFSTTVGAVAWNGGVAVVFGLRLAGVGPFSHLSIVPWLYPLCLVGISLAFFGLVLTWTTWSARQWAAALSAMLAIATAVFLFVGTPSTAPGAAGLAISLFLAAILYQTSGSFLHLISSGTRPHERALITSGQSRMFRFADELRGKEEGLTFREAALVKRETDVDNAEASIVRQTASLEEARQQLDTLESDYRSRSDALVELERSWAGQIAELDARGRLVEDRLRGLELREQEVARLTPQLSTREQRLLDREGSLTQREVTLTQKDQEIQARAGTFGETEARLASRRKELDQKTSELLRREGDLVALESAARAGVASPSAAQAELAAREAKLQEFKSILDEQNLLLGRKARENAEKSQRADELLRSAAEREGAFAAREAGLRDREADLAAADRAAREQRTAYEASAKEYASRLEQLRAEQAELARKVADLDRSTRTSLAREATLATRERSFEADRSAFDTRARALLGRERQLEAGEAELGLRRAEAAERGELPPAGRSAAPTKPTLPESGIPAGSLRSELGPTGEGSAGGLLRAGSAGHQPDRLPTGISRLDDLLLGGLPARSHLVLLGDAFVGKEIVLYSFIAEGLKRGESVVLVTGTRSPEEVAASLGVVLPQFREYEQLGRVTWIDAAGAGGTAGPRRIVAKGPTDRAGILAGLAQVAKSFEGPPSRPFRVGFLGLSAVMTGDDRTGLSFLQNAVGILKLRDALAMYALEGGALSDAQVEALLGRMDGAILFRQDRDKTFLAVKGLGEIQTHDWVECRATNRALIVGSFALERIR